MTYSTSAVLQALEADFRYGFDIAEVTGLRRGTVYPILRRLESAGLVTSLWEAVEISRQEARPARKYYALTAAAADVLTLARSRYVMPWATAQRAT